MQRITTQGEFNWSGEQTAQLFSVVFWSVLLVGAPVGYLSDR